MLISGSRAVLPGSCSVPAHAACRMLAPIVGVVSVGGHCAVGMSKLTTVLGSTSGHRAVIAFARV